MNSYGISDKKLYTFYNKFNLLNVYIIKNNKYYYYLEDFRKCIYYKNHLIFHIINNNNGKIKCYAIDINNNIFNVIIKNNNLIINKDILGKYYNNGILFNNSYTLNLIDNIINKNKDFINNNIFDDNLKLYKIPIFNIELYKSNNDPYNIFLYLNKKKCILYKKNNNNYIIFKNINKNINYIYAIDTNNNIYNVIYEKNYDDFKIDNKKIGIFKNNNIISI
jgi:hypothetical protein